MATISFQFQIDDSSLEQWTDQYLAQVWHIAWAAPAKVWHIARPAPVQLGDQAACAFAERVGREIIRRFIKDQQPEMWHTKAKFAVAESVHADVAPSNKGETMAELVSPPQRAKQAPMRVPSGKRGKGAA